MSIEQRLTELGIELPEPPSALGMYKPVLCAGGMAYTSGHGPIGEDGALVGGRLGADLDVAAGAAAARLTGLSMLASLRRELGSLDRVRRLVKAMGLVQCTPEFTDQPAVINGFSELMIQVLGEDHGKATRSAFGATALPAGMAVEIEAVFVIDPDA